MPTRRQLILAALAAATPLPAFALWRSNKWRIEVSEGANNDGIIVFSVIEPDQDDIEVTARVYDGDGENQVAREIRNAFLESVPRHRFQVELDDGEDILVKARRGTKRFKIKLLESTPRGVRINLDRE